MIKRRRFLKILGLAGIASVIGLGLTPGFEEMVHRLIKNAYRNLSVDDEEIVKFIDEAHRINLWEWLNIGPREKMVIIVFGLLNNPYLPYYRVYHRLVVRITNPFILSTDFFRNGMDTSQPVRYLGIYNPYAMPCANPFSALYYDGKDAASML